MGAAHEESSLRDYVEQELDRTIRRTHLHLGVYEGARWAGDSTEAKTDRLFWTIEGLTKFGVADYIIEARPSDRELLIWFGFSSAGALSANHLICPAVHLNVDELTFMPGQRRHDLSLGAVLERMLQSWDDEPGVRFPMNHRTLT